MKRDFARKVLFSYFLPYGFMGKNALNTCMKMNPVSYSNYDPAIPMNDRVKSCDRTRTSNTVRIGEIERGCYLRADSHKYGTDKREQFSFFSLTRSSLFLLTGTPDKDAEALRIAEASTKLRPVDRNKKEICYLPSPDLQELTKFLYAYATEHEHNNKDAALYDELFLDAVYAWDITPLANSIALAKTVSVYPLRMNGRQQYQAWRTTNVTTMFRLSGFLTCLDRRPIDTGWTFNGANAAKQYRQRLAAGEPDIPSFTHHALKKWYTENPDSYLFQAPGKSLSENREAWLATPSFYGINELPGIKPIVFEDENISATGQQNILRHTCVGVGIGTELNYMIYHTKPRKDLWRSGIEKTSAVTVQEAIDKSDLNNPVPGSNRTISHAIMFCDTIFQFAALFEDTINAKNKPRKRPTNFGYPYESMSIILINGSGVQQLRALMMSTPRSFIEEEVRQLCAKNHEFMRTNDFYYPLAYKNRPVFLAYDLDYYRLRKAIADKRSGKRFYIACFPEQAKFLQKIMPNVDFL